jgi:tRNA(fMet)-specific endonuclease VapC
MTPGPDLILLDTSVVIHLVRGSTAGKAMDKAYGISTRDERPLISIVSLGEARAFASRRGWGDGKQENLVKLFRELVVVDIRSDDVLRKYAEIDAWAKDNGWALSDNDTWIAATAAATGAVLLTNDKDFYPLGDNGLITRIYVAPTTR